VSKPRDEAGVTRAEIFDPALKHLQRAIRLSDPACADPEVERQWRHARRLVMDQILEQVANSSRGYNMVLRGSRVLSAWLGWAAREPGDLDYMIHPGEVKLEDPWSEGMFPEIVRRVMESTPLPGIEILATQHSVSQIWTYERAPGRRLVIPWRAPGLPDGSVQLDVVFGESMAEPPVYTELPLAGGRTLQVRTATPAQSLAWKLLWLWSDIYPQGKDLYDATLLAERTRLSADILQETLVTAPADQIIQLDENLLGQWTVDWDNFTREYPRVKGGAADWKARLLKALQPTFDERPLPWKRPDEDDDD
jgi:hypothetical protein